MTIAEQLELATRTGVAVNDLLRALAVARDTYRVLCANITTGLEIASYNQAPIVPGDVADELRIVLAKSIAFRDDLTANHGELLAPAPAPETVRPTIEALQQEIESLRAQLAAALWSAPAPGIVPPIQTGNTTVQE